MPGLIVGLVWLCAWAFNPNIDSGDVWFIAILLEGVVNHIVILGQD